MRITDTREIALLPPVESVFRVGSSDVQLDLEAADELSVGLEPVRRAIEQAVDPSGDVYVYVHGFASGFTDSVTRTAGLWQMMGRHGLGVSFSWPAARGGFIGTAYQRDRESGEWSVPDLQLLLEVLADIPAVERVHVISHSRGTDVVATTLRELALAYDGDHARVAEKYKLDTVVFAAPDIDAEVFVRRVLIAGVLHTARRVLVYVHPRDGALKASAWMQSSLLRIGQVGLESFDTEDGDADPGATLQIVVVDKRVRRDGHGYFTTDEDVLADLVLALRGHHDPGTYRPLTPTARGVWLLGEGYGEALRRPSSDAAP